MNNKIEEIARNNTTCVTEGQTDEVRDLVVCIDAFLKNGKIKKENISVNS